MTMTLLSVRLGVLLNKPVISVELLPGDGSTWLGEDTSGSQEFVLVDGNLGVPQKPLYKAYLEAVHIFHRSRGVLHSLLTEAVPDSRLDELRRSSSVILLANPAHQTAWNVRKRLMELNLLDPATELGFCASLLTIRDCAKQSLLWHHRRWILSRIYKATNAQLPPSSPSIAESKDEYSLRNLDLPPPIFQTELQLCTLSCNTYERNYFAWAHRYCCLGALQFAIYTSTTTSDASRTAAYKNMLDDEVAWCARWVEQHISDYSAMRYRCVLASVALAVDGLTVSTQEARTDELTLSDAKSLSEHARSLVSSYPEHEALWLYLRGALWTEARYRQTSPEEIQELAAFAQRHAESSEARGNSITHNLQSGNRNPSLFLSWLRRYPLNGLRNVE